jgi:hypothetical protein
MNEQREAQIGPCTATLPRSIVHNLNTLNLSDMSASNLTHC